MGYVSDLVERFGLGFNDFLAVPGMSCVVSGGLMGCRTPQQPEGVRHRWVKQQMARPSVTEDRAPQVPLGSTFWATVITLLALGGILQKRRRGV